MQQRYSLESKFNSLQQALVAPLAWCGPRELYDRDCSVSRRRSYQATEPGFSFVFILRW